MMACCNTLMNIDGDLVGDPLEKAAFLATGWQLSSGTGGGIFRGSFAGTPASVRQIQKFHFSSELKRMAVVVRVSTARGAEVDYVLAKGAPEVLARLLGSCPPGYDRAHRQQASRGGALSRWPPSSSSPPRSETSRAYRVKRCSFTFLHAFTVHRCCVSSCSACSDCGPGT